MDKSISSLINFYLSKQMIKINDIEYCINQITSHLNIECIEYDINACDDLYTSLSEIVGFAVENNIINDFSYERDILESKLTNIFVDKPSIVQDRFDLNNCYNSAMDFYELGVNTNYIKKNDLKRNLFFSKIIDEREIQISINLAKPEKDPKEIEMLKQVQSTSYPKCPLCIENVGYVGSVAKAARSNHRVIEMPLNDQKWMFQYSPYAYYDYHCILFEKTHSDMIVNKDTLLTQLDFVEKFENFFIGNNAAIPIVGGSILNHNHFQGGIYKFPIDKVKTIKEYVIDNVKIEYLDWHLATLRLTTTNKENLISVAMKIVNNWLTYQNNEINIENNNNNNAVNFITFKNKDTYELKIILRNNNTTNELPDGIYHPRQEFHHIKKENIGLIEAMGLAILPGRLIHELDEVKNFITGKQELNNSHLDWAITLKENYKNQNIDQYIEDNLALVFIEILKCCNVLRYSDNSLDVIENLLNN